MKIAFISGTSILKSSIFDDWDVEEMVTSYGPVRFRRKGDFMILNRHGREGVTPPHAINHRANIRAVADLGFADIISLNSVGSLQEDLPPGTCVSCSDYFCLHPATFNDEVGVYEAPSVANNLIATICEGADFPIQTGKTYVQMVGPRFETPAEIRVVRHWGDVIGMNMASEADLSRELGLRYNSLCMIDNYANGLGGTAISGDEFRAHVAGNQRKVDSLFQHLLALFGP